MTTKNRMTLAEAHDAIARSPEWKKEGPTLAGYAFNPATGEKLTHAELASRAWGPNGAYRPAFNLGFVNFAAYEFRRRLDALMNGGPSSVAPQRKEPEPEAPKPSGATPAPTPPAPVIPTPPIPASLFRSIAAIHSDTPPGTKLTEADEGRAAWGRTLARLGKEAGPGMVVPTPDTRSQFSGVFLDQTRPAHAAKSGGADDRQSAASSWDRTIQRLSASAPLGAVAPVQAVEATGDVVADGWAKVAAQHRRPGMVQGNGTGR